MHIKTQELFNEIHDIRTKLQLYQNKKGYNFESETYIQQCNGQQDWLVYVSQQHGNLPLSEEEYAEILSDLEDAKLYVSQLDELT